MSEMMKIPSLHFGSVKKSVKEVAKNRAGAAGARGLPLSRACLAPSSIFWPDSSAHACQEGALTPAVAEVPRLGHHVGLSTA